jgi:outer membrane protein assembly factor BamE (lipoprotein component of BamABCDE complex)
MFTALFALMLATETGCLVATNSTTSRSGNYVSQSTLNQITPNQTTQDWVKSVVGNPTSKSMLADGTEIWKYSYSQRTDNDGYVFLIFAGNDSKEAAGTIFIELKNGLVTRCWQG